MLLGDVFERLHVKRPAGCDDLISVHALPRAAEGRVELPWMPPFLLQPIEGSVPFGPPRTSKAVVVSPAPEGAPRGAVFACAVETEETPLSSAKGDSVKGPRLAA